MPRTRLTTCPETGRPLDGLDIRAHCEHLWPANTPPNQLSKEAKERRDALLAEAESRDTERHTGRDR
jgi:hypothetical protein